MACRSCYEYEGYGIPHNRNVKWTAALGGHGDGCCGGEG